MEFTNLQAGPFADVIAQHTASLDTLRTAHERFATVAEGLSRLLFRSYPISAGVQNYWHERPSTEQSDHGARSQVRAVFARERTAFRPTAAVYDPWDGWWRGNWQNGGQSGWPQYHIWDRTRETNGGFYIQPVTQRRGIPATSTPDVIQRGQDFTTSARLAQHWAAGQVNLAINVWREDTGVTGWVWKKDDGDQILPHIGYLLNRHTLIWITQQHPKTQSNVYDFDYGQEFWMFFEWVDGQRRTYGIHGRKFQFADLSVDGQPDDFVPRSEPLGFTTRYEKAQGIAD